MLSLRDRALLVWDEAWRLLPPLKKASHVAEVRLGTIAPVNGLYAPETGIVTLGEHLFWGNTPSEVQCIDAEGNDPPRLYPLISRGIHTAVHEAAHAIGYTHRLDEHPEWLSLSGWVHAADDPLGTARYWEHRPGWEQGPSTWRHTLGSWHPRTYASRDPFEDFADCAAWLALGWSHVFSGQGAAKMAWLRRHVWGEAGPRQVQAARERWRSTLRQMQAVVPLHQRRPAQWRAQAETALTSAMTRVLGAMRRVWGTAVERNKAWPRSSRIARQVREAITSPLMKLYRQLWGHQTKNAPASVGAITRQAAAITEAASSFGSTTAARLESQVTPLLHETAAVVTQALDKVHQEALAVRTPLMVKTETARTAQAAARDAALLQGTTQATWHTTSGKPCAFCADLEGKTFSVEEMLFAKGSTLTTANGATLTLSYENVFHPPIHPNCACELVYTQ